MAVTIVDSPRVVTYSGQDLIIVATSTETAEPNFKFVVEILDGATTLSKVYVPPNPSGRLIFNARKILENYVERDVRGHLGEIIHAPTGAFTRNTRSIKEITFEIGEVYEVAGVLTEDLALSTFDRILVHGNTLSVEGYRPNFGAFLRSGTANSAGRFPWLSDRCRGIAVVQGSSVEIDINIVNPVIGESSQIIQEVDVYPTDVGLVSFFNTDQGDFADLNTADDIFIEVYNNSTLLNSYTLAISDATGTRPPTSSSIDGIIAHFGGYPANSFMSFFTNTGNPTWTHYRFRLNYDGGSASNWIQFRRRTGVCKADAKRLAWSNRWGGWDYFWFDGSAEYILDAERKTYRKIRGSYSGTTYDHDYYDAGTANFYNNV